MGIDVSYAGEELGVPVAKNTAIHIDLKTPIATDPTWSKLPESIQEKLACDLFGKLVSYLRPDVVLFSTGKLDFLSEFGLGKPDFSYTSIFSKKLLLELYQNEGVAYIWGSPNNNPFMMIRNEEWDIAFSELCKYLSISAKPEEGVFWVVPAIPHKNLSHLYEIFQFEVMEGVFDFHVCETRGIIF